MYAKWTLTEICWFHMIRLTLVVLNDKDCIFRGEFYKNSSKSQFYENGDENLIYVWYVYHWTLSTLWHVYLFAYDRFNWRDGIRYSYISFCAKSASISLVDFSVDIVASKTYFRWKFKTELQFICAKFQIFSTLSKHDIVILVSISHGNRSLTSYVQNVLIMASLLIICYSVLCRHLANLTIGLSAPASLGIDFVLELISSWNWFRVFLYHQTLSAELTMEVRIQGRCYSFWVKWWKRFHRCRYDEFTLFFDAGNIDIFVKSKQWLMVLERFVRFSLYLEMLKPG